MFIDRAEKNIPEGQEEEAGRIISEWKAGKMAVLL